MQDKIEKAVLVFYNHADLRNFNFHGFLLFSQLHKRPTLSSVGFL